ncbi:MAG: DUF4173 domain-containing protein [Flavobacteriia bacterium]|nr:DUF4173 domain-containing protein [Flavobacteriia bacterium]
MKNKNWIITGVAGIYSYLFYSEYVGLNIVLFTCILIGGFVSIQRNLFRNKAWLLIALASFFSALSTFIYGNNLAFGATIVSLMILSGISLSSRSSIFFSLFYGMITLGTSPYFMICDFFKKKQKGVEQSVWKKKLLLIVLPLLVTIVFFLIYKNSNPIFSLFADKINFNWISWSWIFFTILGFILVFGFYNPVKFKSLSEIDEVDSLKIEEKDYRKLFLNGKEVLIVDEYFSGKVLFVLLNSLIAIVNILDVNFVLLDSPIPEGLTMAQFLHQGVGMLVVSILISILIILFFFRGQLNYFEKNKTLKLLAYIWILQNIFMLISVCFKNNLYIESYGLTYKRIGIYVYVLLTIIGLVTTYLKVRNAQKNLYLVRVNGWTFYVVFVISCFVNWDQLIVDYNQKGKHEIDAYYMLSMSDVTLPSLIQYSNRIKDIKTRKFFRQRLKERIKNFQKHANNRTWKSNVYLYSKVNSKLYH